MKNIAPKKAKKSKSPNKIISAVDNSPKAKLVIDNFHVSFFLIFFFYKIFSDHGELQKRAAADERRLASFDSQETSVAGAVADDPD